ncbi:MAG: 4Fe-4S dicluster domain-containing protein [Terriglobales bacterium]
MSATEHPVMAAAAVIVGAGPAGLACALRLAQLLDQHAGQAGLPSKDEILVLEKGREVGAHLLSGAVMDPCGLAELWPDFAREAPLASPVTTDAAFFLTPDRSWRFPITPPPLRNHGNYVISLNRLGKWLGEKVEQAGVTIFPATGGAELLFDGDRVIGVRTDDKGRDKQGRPKANFEPGYDLQTPWVVLAEGPRGSLTKQLLDRAGLGGANPQVYSLGVKEIWEVPPGRMRAGEVAHTMGWPLAGDMYGGGWIYGLSDRQISIGLVTGLEYLDPATDPFVLFQRFKTHPWVRHFLEGGEMVRYGAKAVPMGGYFALPPAAGPGWMLIGDAAGYLNSQRLKGIHLAIKSGMLAAEALCAHWTGGGEAAALAFPRRVQASYIGKELWSVRNFHQGFEHGLARGLLHGAAQMATGGRGLRARYPAIAGHLRMRKLQALATPPPPPFVPDGRLTFGKMEDVYHSGTRHEEDQPAHLLIQDTDICNNRCTWEYGNPCQHFCPAAVYEMVPGPDGGKQIHLNPSNCVHCKTCDIMDPYEIITWVPPEGGGGPNYEGE